MRVSDQDIGLGIINITWFIVCSYQNSSGKEI